MEVFDVNLVQVYVGSKLRIVKHVKSSLDRIRRLVCFEAADYPRREV